MTIAALATAAGSSLQALATTLELRLEFLERVDTGFQPLPLDLVIAIANTLGIDRNTVRASVPRLTTVTSLRTRQPRPLTIERNARPVRLAKTQLIFAQESFSPGTVLGQQIFGWFRSDIGVTGVATVTAIEDQSTANNDLATSARHPSLVASGVEDLPRIRFTEVGSQEIGFPGGGIAGTSGLDWTFIFAVDPTVITGSQEGNLFTVWTGAADGFSVAHEIDVGTSLGYFNDSTWTAIAPATTGIQILAFIFDEGALEVRVYRNKVLLGTGPYVPFDITPGGFVQLLGGSTTRIGASTNTPDMDLYEVACYGQPIDLSVPGEWDRLHADYFLPRYGLS